MAELDNEKTLIARAQGGDRTAFDELAAAGSRLLLARIERRLGPELRAELDPEDVLQEALFRAFRSVDKFSWQGEGSFARWLHGIALKIILHAARERGKSSLLRIAEEPLADEPSPGRRQRREERFDRLESSLALLSAEHRQVVSLARIEGLSIAAIAERMKRTPGSVRNLLYRAMQQLRESFGDTESLGLPGRSIEEGGAGGQR